MEGADAAPSFLLEVSMRSEHDNADLLLVCCDCGAAFVFTAGERMYFTAHSLTLPKRCKPCRAARRAEREAAGDVVVPQPCDDRATWRR